MKTAIFVLSLLLATAASAGTYNVVIPAGTPDDTFQAQCAALHDDLGNPPNWDLDKCARRFVIIGVKAAHRVRVAEQEFQAMKAAVNAQESSLEAALPEE